MKANSIYTPGPATRLLASALAGLLVAGPAGAGLTDIANIPLVNATSKVVLPNIWFVLDDSGSMYWETLPGASSQTQFIPRLTDFWAGSHCNGLGYNPAVTYKKPPSLGSTTYNDVPFTAACDDGFAKSGCSVDFTLPEKNPVYFTYSGAEPDIGFSYNAAGGLVVNNFYNECNTASAKIVVGGGASTCSVTSVKVGTTEILSAATATSGDPATVAKRIAANINKPGYAAVVSPSNNKTVLIYSTSAADAGKAVTTSTCSGASKITFGYTNFPSAAAAVGMGKFTPVKLTASSSAAEKTNYANWYSYYRDRISMAKSSIADAFKDIRGTPKSFAIDPADGDFFHARVGFSSINHSSADLAIANFEGAQKSTFFNRLYAAGSNSNTPLRTALENAGIMYQDSGASAPIQYYCQRNNVLLTTDGYWNSTDPSGPGSANHDGGTTPRPQYEGPTATTKTLADLAMYYYKTDLRTGGDFDKLLPEPSSSANPLIDDVIRTQHMTTFAVGMGVDGTLKFDPAYKTTTDTTSAFYKILNDTGLNWPVPVSNTVTAVDDLWHAAVNGRGTYFSAKNPRALAASLKLALTQMNVDSGSGGANATGALNPTPGVDRAYTASYQTSDWTGDVAAYQIDSNGYVSTSKAWSAAVQLKNKITVDGKSDTRTIHTGTTTLVPFKATSLGAGDLAYFDNSQLNQYIDEWTVAQKAAGTATTLINYLRGQNEYEVKSGATAQLYRARKEILGDIIHSQPVYVGKPSFYFQDAGYAAFKGGSRAAAVYVGANDGMLHAFDAATGNENWAYVPPAVYPGLWRIADRDYSINHRYFVDGTIAVSDAYFGGAWHTVLIGGLGAGGRGYFALDITNPATPSLLWTFSADNNPNVGYAFGAPLMAKLANGTWVAILASGYNNVPEGSKYAAATGKGYVFVLNLATGAVIKTIETNAGSTASPSGLATLNVEVNSVVDYTVKRAYGGDLEGNMWRFDLAGGTASKLMDLGSSQPITSAPEIARPNGSSSAPLVLFGTGRYLGRSDLEDGAQQSFYAVKDDGSTNVSVSNLTQQFLSSSGVLNASSNVSQWGWYFNLPNSGERVNIHPQIQLGVLLFVTTVPPPASLIPANQDAACIQDAGTGWLYQVNYKNGNSVDGDNQVGIKLESPPVGMVLTGTKNITSYNDDISKPDGQFHVTTGKSKTVSGDIKKPKGSGVPGSATRLQWRELLK